MTENPSIHTTALALDSTTALWVAPEKRQRRQDVVSQSGDADPISEDVTVRTVSEYSAWLFDRDVEPVSQLDVTLEWVGFPSESGTSPSPSDSSTTGRQTDVSKASSYGWKEQVPFRSTPPIAQLIRGMLSKAREERFEDGVLSNFGTSVLRLVSQFGATAIDRLTTALFRPEVTTDVVAEAMSWIARIDDRQTHAKRRKLLEIALTHLSPQVRDAAVLGLARMGDAASISALQAAQRNEPIPELRDDITQVLSQFRD